MTPLGRPMAGVVWMLVTGVFLVGVTAAVKHAAVRLPPAEAAFLRYLIGLLFFIPMLPVLRRVNLSRRTIALFSLRGAAQTLGVIAWFFAMTRIPIAEVTALNYLTPVYVSVGAALFLGEQLAFRRIVAVAVGLLGVVIVLRPGLRAVEPGHLAMLFATMMFAGSYLSAKVLSDRNEPLVVVAMLSLTVTIGLAPFAAADWIQPTVIELCWFLLIAFLATAGHFTMTLAFRAAPMTVTQPVTFLQLVWASLLGWLVFGEGLDGFVVLGGVMILAAVSFITWRESVQKRRDALVKRDPP